MCKGYFLGLLITLLVPSTLVYADCPNGDTALHDEAKLHKDMSKCASNYRPVKDYKTTINVKIRLSLKYMIFDNTEEKITINSWMAIYWKDEYINWTPSQYGNIKEIQMESHMLWTPSVMLYNADVSIYQSDRFYTMCLVTNDGIVTCVPQMSHTAICRTSLSNWPYDEKLCVLNFGSSIHTQNQVNLTFYQTRPVISDDFQDAPGWKLLKVYNNRVAANYSCCPNTTFPMLKYTFLLRREAAGPAAIIIFPSLIILTLTLSSLLLDVKDNTRLALLCFSIFGHFTYITEIDYFAPKLGAETPTILLLIRDSLIVNLIGILETLLLMYLRRRTIPAPNWIVSVNRLITNGPGKYIIITDFDPCDGEAKNVLSDEGSSSAIEETRNNNDWIKLSNIINSLIFIVSLLVYIVLLCMYMPTSKV